MILRIYGPKRLGYRNKCGQGAYYSVKGWRNPDILQKAGQINAGYQCYNGVSGGTVDNKGISADFIMALVFGDLMDKPPPEPSAQVHYVIIHGNQP